MIKTIRLLNWRSHADTELSFKEGTNLLVGSMGSGKSLPYNELIIIKDKLWSKKKIGDVVEKALSSCKTKSIRGDIILTHENPDGLTVQSLDLTSYKMMEKPISAFIKHKAPPTLLRIKTRTGKSVTVTGDHSLLVATDVGNITPLKASVLKVGDLLPCPKKINFGKGPKTLDVSTILPDFRKTNDILAGLEFLKSGLAYKQAVKKSGISRNVLDNWKRRKMKHEPNMLIAKNLQQAIHSTINIDSAFAKLAGAYLAEGHTDYNENACRYSIKITNEDSIFVKETIESINQTFPWFHHNYTTSNDIQINGKIISALFYRLFGHSAGNKRVPDFFYSVDDLLISDFLMMYFEGDGWVYNDEVACCSKSRKLIDGIQTLFLRWGIISCVRERIIKDEKYYTLVVLPKHVPIFCSKMRFLSTRKQIPLEKIANEISKRKRWDGVDTIPNVELVLRGIRRDYHMHTRSNPRMRRLAKELHTYEKYEKLGREKLKRSLKEIADTYGHKTESFLKLERLAYSDIFFDEVTTIEEIPTDSEYVYDLSVEGENFTAGIGNILVHNSSVMDAISFALFGTFPALERRKLKLADLFRMNEQNASLILEFSWNGSEYKIERKITKGKKRVESEAEVFQKGKLETDQLKQKLQWSMERSVVPSDSWKLMDSAPKAVTEYVEQLLAVDYDLFTRAIYSEQNNIDYFLTIDPRRRKQELDQLLGLDRFEQARSNIVSVINRIKSNRKLLESRFDREKHKQAMNKLELQEKELISLLAKQKELDKQAEEKKKTLVNAESAFLEMKKKKEQYENNSKEKLRLEATLSQLEEELSGAVVDEHKHQNMVSELQIHKKKKEQLTKIKIDTDSTISSLSKDLGSAEAKLKRIDQADKELKDARKRLQEMLGDQSLVELIKKKDEIEKEAISLFSEKKSLISGIEEIDEMLKNLTPGQSTCPLCDNPLGESGTEHIIEEKKKRIDEHKKKIEGLEKLISEKKNLFSQLSELIKKADSIGTSISTNEKEMSGKDETKSTLQDLTEKLKIQTKKKKEDEDSSEKLDKAIHDMSIELNKLETRLKKQKQAKEFSAKLEEIKKRLIGLAFNEEEFEKQRKTLEEERISIAQMRKEKESVDKQVSMLREIANQIKREIEQFSATEKEIEKYSKIEEQLIIFKNALLETQTSLRSGLSDAINSAMSEIWAIFYPYQNYSKIKLSVTEKDYLFELLDNDQWKQLESIASGGERACAALSLRVALAMVLTPNLSWLILDEPTHNLDSEAVRLLSETLQTKVPEVVKQTFVITHEEGLMGADFSTSYRLSRDKSGLGPTKQELI